MINVNKGYPVGLKLSGFDQSHYKSGNKVIVLVVSPSAAICNSSFSKLKPDKSLLIVLLFHSFNAKYLRYLAFLPQISRII
jgi:hypothetical protein